MTKNGVSSITVSELIAILEDMDGDKPVLFAYDYGDHWHTTVAASISEASVKMVRYSDYHSMNKVITDDENCEEETTEDSGAVEAVVLE